MDLFVKLFDVLFPVFLTISIGYWYGKKDPTFDTEIITKFAGNIGLPSIIFYSLTTSNIDIQTFLKFSKLIIFYVIIFSFIGIFFIKIFKKDIYRLLPPIILPNTGNMGMPICLFAYGTIGLSIATAITSIILVLHFSLGILLASREFSIKPLLKCTPIYALIFSLFFVYFNIPAPKFLENATFLLGYSTIFLVLMSLGVALSKLKVFFFAETLTYSLIRVLIGPLVGFAFIILSLLAQTYIDVRINEWYKGFYDLLQKPEENSISDFYDGIFLFLKLAIPYVIIYAITNYFTRLYGFRWREAITFAYMPYWKKVDSTVEGASQRIQEDCMNFAKIVESIGLQVVRALMLLIAFIPILWGLSSNVVIPFLIDINGSLVYVSLVASLGGVLISWLVGIKLPGLEYNNQVVEAAFRKELVYGEDDRIEYAKAPTILELFSGIKFNYHRLFLHYGYFDLWLIMYNQSMVIVPYIVMGPGLFTGAMTLGILIQTSSAFREVQGSFSLFMQNWTRITELRSIIRRLSEFEKAIGYNNISSSKSDI